MTLRSVGVAYRGDASPLARIEAETLAAMLRLRLPDVVVLVLVEGAPGGLSTPDGRQPVTADDVAAIVRCRAEPDVSTSTGPSALVLGGSSDGIDPLPPVTLLSGCVADDLVLAASVDILRLRGAVPLDGGYLLAVGAFDPGTIGRLRRFAASAGLAVVLSPGAAPGAPVVDETEGAAPLHVLPEGEPSDLLAACSAARIVIVDEPLAAGMAVGIGLPTIGLCRDPALVTPWPRNAVVVDDETSLAEAMEGALGPGAGAGRPSSEMACLEEALDALADALGRGGRETAGGAGTADLERRLRILGTVNSGLERRLRDVVVAFGTTAAPLLRPPADDERQRLWARAVEAERVAGEAVKRAHDSTEAAARAGGVAHALGLALTMQQAEQRRLRDELAAAQADADVLRAEIETARSRVALPDSVAGAVGRLRSRRG